MPTRRGTVQLWPEWLESEQVPARDEAVFAMQEVPFNTSEVVDIPAFHGDRPVVLVTLGTVVDDLALLNTAVRAVLDAGADALVMTGFTTGAEKIEGDSDRVRAVPFAPMAQLLDRVQAVIGVGGSGTTLSALSRGPPLAFVPRMANNPQVASVVAGFGAGVVCDDPVKLTEAVPMLLNEPELRARAQDASDLLGRRAAPGEVWSALRNLIGTTGE
jgi:UDP:flavonoid glycosyltransferase YjiC (YdhE family)